MKIIDANPDTTAEPPDHGHIEHDITSAPNDAQTAALLGNQLRDVTVTGEQNEVDQDSMSDPPIEIADSNTERADGHWSGRLPAAVIDAQMDDQDDCPPDQRKPDEAEDAHQGDLPQTAQDRPTILSDRVVGEEQAAAVAGGNGTPGNNEPPEGGGHDPGDVGDENEDDDDRKAGDRGQPKWVETRSVTEIEALKDKDQYTNEDLAALWKTGDPEAAAAYLSRNSGYIHTVVRRNIHIDEHGDPDEVLQQFEFHLLRALQTYEPDRGAKSLTYAGDIAEKQLQSGREPSRDSVGAQPRIRAVERKVNALDHMLEHTGGYTEISGSDLDRLRLTDDQREALRRVEERVRTHGYSPLSDDEVLQILGRLDVSSSSSLYMSSETLRTVRQHTKLTGRLLSTDHSAPEYPIWLGDKTGKVSDDESTSHARPVLEGPQEGVDEIVENKLMDESLRAGLPAALEALQPREREILHMRVVQGLAAERVAEHFTESGDPLSRQRIYQIEAGILDPSRDGSARGTLFRYRLAEAAGIEPLQSPFSPEVDRVMQARQALTAALPHLDERTAGILNDYFILDGRDTTRTLIPDEIAQKYGMSKRDVSRIIDSYVSDVSGERYPRDIRKAMLEYAPIRHPLTDDEKRKWGIVA